jgi:hypothetical protein
MVRKLGEVPKFFVFRSRTKSLGNSSIFTFYLLLFAFIQISVFACWAICMGLVTFLCLRFRWSWTITPTSTSSRMVDCVPMASTTRGFWECYMTHSSILGTTGMLWSTIADCPWLTACTGVRSVWRYLEHHMEMPDTELEERAEMIATSSSSSWSFRCSHNLSLSTTRRPMPYWASMRTRSRHC